MQLGYQLGNPFGLHIHERAGRQGDGADAVQTRLAGRLQNAGAVHKRVAATVLTFGHDDREALAGTHGLLQLLKPLGVRQGHARPDRNVIDRDGVGVETAGVEIRFGFQRGGLLSKGLQLGLTPLTPSRLFLCVCQRHIDALSVT